MRPVDPTRRSAYAPIGCTGCRSLPPLCLVSSSLVALRPAPASAGPTDALHETVATLEAQLVSLHAKREAEVVVGKALRAAVESLEEQARAWYASVERLGGRTVDEAADALMSYEAQLHALYAALDATAGDATAGHAGSAPPPTPR